MARNFLTTELVHSSHNLDSSPPLQEEHILHCHNFYEVYFFISGDLDYLVEGKNYQPTPYSLLLIAPNAFHGFQHKSKIPYERISFHFLPEILPQVLQESLLKPFHGKDIFFQDLGQYQLEFYLASVLEAKSFPSTIQMDILQSRVVALLSEIYKIVSLVPAERAKKNTAAYSLDHILLFINNNLDQRLTLDDICKRFYISKNHLNRLFKKTIGTTVNSYINYKRLTLAKQYMLQDQTATQAALNAGFGDYSNFYRTCRNLLGVSPSDLQHQIIDTAEEFWQ